MIRLARFRALPSRDIERGQGAQASGGVEECPVVSERRDLLEYLGDRLAMVALFDLDEQQRSAPPQCLGGASQHVELGAFDINFHELQIDELERVQRLEGDFERRIAPRRRTEARRWRGGGSRGQVQGGDSPGRRERDGMHVHVPKWPARRVGSKDRDTFWLRFKRFDECAPLGEQVCVESVIRAHVSNTVPALNDRRNELHLSLEKSTRSLV